jgi:cytoskeletal protein CcmA (bactofilin family)
VRVPSAVPVLFVVAAGVVDLLASGGVAHAHAGRLRSGDIVVIDPDDVILGNLYASGANVTMHGHVTGDLVVAGGTVVVDGEVDGDVLGFGGQVILHGPVGGDVRVAGGSVALDAPVRGDVVVGAGMVTLGGDVDGDALLLAGTAQVDGSVDGAVFVTASDTAVNGTVGGDVVAEGETLKVGPRARLEGDLEWTGAPHIERDDGASIAGRVTVHPTTTTTTTAPARWLSRVFGGLQLFVGLYALGLFWWSLFTGFALRAAETLRARPGASFGAGIAAFVGVPLTALALGVVGLIVGGAWLAPITLALFALATALAFPLVAGALGQRLRRARDTGLGWPLALVLFVTVVLVQLPVVGALVGLVVVCFGLGALALTLGPTLRFARAPSPDTAPLPATSAAASSSSPRSSSSSSSP